MAKFHKPHDVVSELDHDEKLMRYQIPTSCLEETGWDRLRQMYSLPRWRPSPELHIAISAATVGSTLGFMSGSWNTAKQAKENFIRQNKHQKFFNSKDYHRKLLDYVFLQGTRSGLRLGWRVGLFSGLYSLGVMTAAVYRNKFGILEHVISGGVAAAIYRSHVGLRGMWFGTIVGMIFGTCSGLVMFSVTKFLGASLAEVRYDYYQHFIEIWEEEDKLKIAKLAEQIRKEEEAEKTRI